MLKLFIKLFVIVFLFNLPVLSKDYNNIIISGNDRISNDTILVFADIPENKPLDDDLLNLLVSKL